MRLFFLPILVSIFSFLQAFFVANTVFAECAVSTTLRVDIKGAEVQCLQAKLGITADGIFGPKTSDSVKAFQGAHKLIADGIVGPLTRTLVNKVVLAGGYPEGCLSLSGYSTKTGKPCFGALSQSQEATEKTTEDINPNLTNLDLFIETVLKTSKEQGSSEKELKIIEDALRKGAKTSEINFSKEFEKLLIQEAEKAKSSSTNWSPFSFINRAVSKTLSFFRIIPQTAHALTGIPFGGAIIYTYFCAYSANWAIGITPLPPSFVTLLSYIPGTQWFASRNIPYTRWLLGEYEPFGTCVIPAPPPIFSIPIPTQGTITPFVGSSPL